MNNQNQNPKEMKQFNNKVETKLKQYLQIDDAKLNQFKDLLVSTESIIAGGSILGFINNEQTTNDFDIYVSAKNTPMLKEGLKNMFGVKTVNIYNASVYCESFLKKNNIRKVSTLARIVETQHPNIFQIDLTLNFDIMSIRKKSSPIQVASNFDLTFCQVWYDGKSVFATHPDHITSKKGFLQKDYIKSFYKKNLFTMNRLEKYNKKGYTISVKGIEMDYDEILKPLFKCKKIYQTNK